MASGTGENQDMRAGALLLATALALTGAPAAGADSLAAQVNRAIDGGVAKIRSWQAADGSFDSKYKKDHPEGVTALALYALLKSGVTPDDPAVRKAVDWLRYRKPTTVYGASLWILALDALGDPGKDPEVQAVARWLEDAVVEKEGTWAYSPESRKTDISNTQFAVLGLWAAERHGFKVKDGTWSGLLLRIPVHQTEEGGFYYSTNREPRIATGSRTGAGILILEIAAARADPERTENGPLVRRAREVLKRAWDYMDRRFIATSSFEGEHAFRHDFSHAYYLWGIERIAAVAGRDRIGGKDWYREGAEVLVASQEKDGDWGSFHETCIALLFLRRATSTLAGRAPAPPTEGEAVAAAPAGPVKPAPGTPFLRRWLLLGPLPDPADALLGDPPFKEGDVRPRDGNALAGKGVRWGAWRSATDRVDLGAALGAGKGTVAWAFAYLHAEEAQDAVIWIGADSGFRLLLDGTLVHDGHFHEGRTPDRVGIPVRLEKGAHRLLLGLESGSDAGGFCVRLARPDGKPVTGVLPSLSEARSEAEEAARAQPGMFPLPDLLRLLPAESDLSLKFEDAASLLSVSVAAPAFTGRWPRWLEGPPAPKARGPGGAFQGALGLHPEVDGKVPARILRKVRVPGGRSALLVRACAEVGESAGKSDTVVRLGVFADDLHWLREEILGGEPERASDPWRSIEAPLDPWAGREVLLVVEVATGGRSKGREEAWFDEISVVHR